MADEDPTDIFDTALAALFAIPPIAFSPAQGHYYVYTPPVKSDSTSNDRPKPIELAVPQPPPSLYKALQANNVWLAGIYLADLITLDQINVKGKNVAELGAGAGLPGIVACRDGGAGAVVSSDWGVEEVLNVLKDNFTRACGGKGWNVVGHEWGTDPAPLLRCLGETATEDKFDILLLADILWATDAHSALLDSIGNLLRPGGEAHIAAGLHTGRGPVERFVAKAKERGWSVEGRGEVRWKIEGGWEKYDESMSNSNAEEERGVVVWLTLRV